MKRMLLAAIAALSITGASAAEFNALPHDKVSVVMQGNIDVNDGQKLQNVINYRKSKHLLTGLILDSLGGNVAGAWDMAQIIEREGIIVGVANGSYCASACVLMLAAGKHRYIASRAYIGVHSASDTNSSSDSDVANSATEQMTAAFMHFHVPFQVTRKMVATPGTQSTWLNADDIIRWPNTTILTEETK